MSDDRHQPTTRHGEAWVYESIVGSVPGVRVSRGRAIAVQFGGFEVAVLALAWLYGLPMRVVLAGTVAVAVATAGSVAMTTIADAVRAADPPDRYRHLLFGTRIEVVLGLLSYAGLLTYLFAVDPRASPTLLVDLFGGEAPAPAVFVLLLLLWDVCYRIGAAWWASVTALWRSLRCELPPEAVASLRRADLATLGFGVLQLALLPFLLGHPVLFVAVGGHVVAVVIVTSLALAQA